MRENEPVFRDRNGLAAAASYQAVIEAERQPELFSNAGGIRPDQPGVEMMIEMDDPQHLLRRKLVNSGFTRKRVKDLETSINSLCDTLIDAVCERGECDFVWDIAAPLPMAVIGDMLGVRPQEREMFLKWSDDLVSSLSSTAAEADIQVTMDAFAAYSGHMTGMIEERKKAPTDDLVSVLVHAEVEGSQLEDHQIVTEVLLLLIGGDETTRHTLSGGTRAATAASRAASAPGRRPGPAAQCDRRDASLDGSGQEHGPDHHRRHRIPRRRPQRGRRR